MENKTISIADELLKLNQLKEKGVISEEEFIETKNMLLKTKENKKETYVKKTFLNTFPTLKNFAGRSSFFSSLSVLADSTVVWVLMRSFFASSSE